MKKFNKEIAQEMYTRFTKNYNNAVIENDTETIEYYSKKIESLLKAANNNNCILK